MAQKRHRGSFGIYIVIFLLMVMASRFQFSRETNRWESQGDGGENTKTDIVEEIDIPADIDVQNYDRRMYRQLTEEEQSIYRVIQQTLENMQETCTIERITGTGEQAKNTLLRAIDAVYYDYPEYFWYNHSIRWTVWHYDGYVKAELTLSSYEYWDYVLDKQAYVDEVAKKAQEIADLARQFESTFDKVKYVHDYLVTYAEYDYDAAAEVSQTIQKASSQQAHSVYGCLVNRKSVCDGYAKSFQMIMNLLEIDCEYIEGDAGGAHAWNYIVLDDENYWMDVTWDDYNRRDEDGNMAYPNGVDYAYFCITSDTLFDTHTPNDTFEIPECDAEEYNFFRHENSYLETYTFEALLAGVEEQKGAQIISLKFASQDAMDQAIEDLFGANLRYLELPNEENCEMMYSYDNTKYILSFLYH